MTSFAPAPAVDRSATDGDPTIANYLPGASAAERSIPARAARAGIVIAPNWLVGLSAACVVVGFALIAYTWDRVSTLTIVAAQIPYLASSGLTGLGLVVVGAALLIVWSRRSDDTERRRQTDELISALRDIRAGLDNDEGR